MTDETTWGEWLNAAQVGVVKRYGRDAANLYTEFLDAEYANRLEAYRALAEEVLSDDCDFWWGSRFGMRTELECQLCGGIGPEPGEIGHTDDCPKARYDALNGQEPSKRLFTA